MSISDAQYALWLKQGKQRVVLCHLPYAYTNPAPGSASNVALASTGASAAASSTYPRYVAAGYVADGYVEDFDPENAIDGNTSGSAGYWRDDSAFTFPKTFDITFSTSKTIDHVTLYSVQDDLATATVTDSMIGTQYVIRDFDVQTWNGSAWVTQASVTGNVFIKCDVRFTAIATTKVRINIRTTADGIYARLTEVAAFTTRTLVLTGTLYLAAGRYVSAATDTPASQPYLDCIAESPRYSRGIDVATQGGAMQIGVGNMVLDNTDGRLDFLQDVVLDGRAAHYYLGDPRWPLADFRELFVATASHVSRTARGALPVYLRDRGLLLDKSIVGTALGGTGPNAQKPATIAVGCLPQVEAWLVDATSLRYRFADSNYYYWDKPSTTKATDVRVNGVSMLVGSFTAASGGTLQFNYAADHGVYYPSHGLQDGDVVYFSNVASSGYLPTATPSLEKAEGGTLAHGWGFPQYWVVSATTDTFKLALTKGGTPIYITGTTWTGFLTVTGRRWFDHCDGSITLSANPGSATVTVEMNNDQFDPGNPAPASACYPLIYGYAALPASNYLGAHGSYGSPGGTYDPALAWAKSDRVNLIDLLNEIALSSNSFYGWTRLGKFTFGRLQPHDIAGLSLTSQMTFTDASLVKDDCQVEHFLPQWRYVQALYDRNYPPITTFADEVTATVAQTMKADGKVQRQAVIDDTDYATTPWIYHKTMIDSPVIPTLISSRNSAPGPSNWVDFYQRKFLPHLEVRSFTAPFEAYVLELGDVVTCNMPLACGDTGATLWQVLTVDIESAKKGQLPSVALKLIRRRTPDVTTVH